MNVLIAMMNSTYSNIESVKEQQWRLQVLEQARTYVRARAREVLKFAGQSTDTHARAHS